MRKKIELSVGSVAGALDRFERVWRRAGPCSARRAGPVSISELARILGRNYKNVHTDVTRLAELGLIERRSDQRIVVGWDTIAAAMSLAA